MSTPQPPRWDLDPGPSGEHPYPAPPPGPPGPVPPVAAAGTGVRRGGIIGTILAALAAVFGYGKYLLLLVGKFAILKSLLTLILSFGLYAIAFPLSFATGLIVNLFLHEMGHVVEIRRQGFRASVPYFIPFMGAIIFQREHPENAYRQAQVGIAGPVAGALAATGFFLLYGLTGWHFLLVWAWLGFLLNAFNMIPVGMLDGAWVLAPVSRWAYVFGFGLLAVLILGPEFGLDLGFRLSPILLIVILMGIPAVIDRFRNDRSPYYQSVPQAARWGMGLAWLALTGYLAFALLQAGELINGGSGTLFR